MSSITHDRTEILVGIDGTDHADDAVHLARDLATATGARLVLVRAYPADAGNTVTGSVEWNRMLEADARRQLEAAADGIPDLPDAEQVTVPVRSGARALHDLAVERGASLVVVGSSHSGRLGRVLPGATAERLLHGSPCPVAVAPHGYAERPRHSFGEVGVAWDDRREADAALGLAQALALAFASSLRVVRVFEPPVFVEPGDASGMSYPTLANDLRALARGGLDDAVAQISDVTPSEGRLVDDEPARALIEQSESLDLLVCGSRGYGPLRAVLLGGVTGQVIRDAACPVVVVPRGAMADLNGVEAVQARAAVEA